MLAVFTQQGNSIVFPSIISRTGDTIFGNVNGEEIILGSYKNLMVADTVLSNILSALNSKKHIFYMPNRTYDPFLEEDEQW